MANIIDGKGLAAKIREDLKREVAALKAMGITPGLAVVLVGDNPASKVYVNNKKKACEEAGIRSVEKLLPANVPEKELLSLVDSLNRDSSIHGILVQLPLPKHLDAEKVIEKISPDKDVDGFHPFNVGRLAIGLPGFEPCTPKGIMALLDATSVELAGKDAVIIGRSNIVGKPMAHMLIRRSSTVTVCHSKTKDLAGRVGAADIVVAAIGSPNFIKGDWVKQGAVVIDVGINRTDKGLVGDVDFEGAVKKASFITPVPGGVGPMTIAMLLVNTVEAAKRKVEGK